MFRVTNICVRISPRQAALLLMTNNHAVPQSFLNPAQVTATALVLSIVLMACAHGQGLRPSGALRLPDAATGSRIAPAQGSAQRQADFIVAVVNSEPITNNEVRSKLIRTEQQMLQMG